MQLFALLVPLFASFLAVSPVSGAAVVPTSCAKETVVSEHFIGRDNNVKVIVSRCKDEVVEKRAMVPSNSVCGFDCTYTCYTPADGTPDKADCQVISDALYYDEHQGTIGSFFTITAQGTPGDRVTMQYKSCQTSFQNQASSDLSYCRGTWGDTIGALASYCDADQNAHGGRCVATDGRWYVEVTSQ